MVTRRIRPGWWLDAALLAVFAGLTAALANGRLLDLDLSVRSWSDAHRPRTAESLARILNYLGNGGPLTVIALLLAAVVAWRLRSLRPLLVPVAAFVVTTGVILPLKHWTDRAAPRSPLPDAVEIFNDLPPGEYGESYLSGHVVVAIVWYGVLVALLAALVPVPPAVRAAIRAGLPLLMLATTTYLSYHWLTDGIAGLCVGIVLDRLIGRLPWLTLEPVSLVPAASQAAAESSG